jgi:hypothetical protein
MGTTLSRLARAALQRRAARECPPHPAERIYWQLGDAMTPDQRVCGQCFAVLARRRHEPEHER